ncbi:DNA-directed DNA polymerase II small subunit [Haloglomus salinum]|uniref:DNA-directed DNA polymerase II small subunit n=1 Tax=Haloglomus salinum TaxID=2962673 RepID=UPI0020CA24D3|nr:DNA-directed DNA polymerase II small subunit [Haloglomus salinum]
MPLEEPVAVARALASHGFNADREAVTLLANAPDPKAAIAHVTDGAPSGTTRLTAADVRPAIEATADDTPAGGGTGTADRPDTTEEPAAGDRGVTASDGGAAAATPANAPEEEPTADLSSGGDPPDDSSSGGGPTDDTLHPNPSVSTGTDTGSTSYSTPEEEKTADTPVEAEGSRAGGPDPSLRSIEISGDITGRSTGTGRYEDFVAVFRDRYERLSRHLKGRVNHRSTDTLGSGGSGGGEAGLVGMVAEVNSTKSGHWMIDLEDPRGTFPCLVMKDKEIADHVNELLLDEVIAVEGSVSGDGSILFVDDLHFPDIPRTYRPNTADRPVRAALISDVHVGSQEFLADAWSRFADWLHTEEAHEVEYLCIAGDMVEGVGVYPDQDEELDIVDIYDQYEAFAEYLKEVPGDMEIIMIPGNHDAVRLAEPQPGFDDELRDIMDVHDPRIVGNPATVTIEGVNILMYHGVSLDEVIAELPEEKASYDEPHKPMYQLLKKRHVAPQFGGHTRLAPEEKDYLVMDEVPDIFHTGHVHKFGYGKYRNVLAVNTGCWQAQTDFQQSVNIDPDTAYAPIVDLHRLDKPDPMTIYDFN